MLDKKIIIKKGEKKKKEDFACYVDCKSAASR